jgi:hypothetical protein
VKADAQGITVKRGPAESVVPFSSLTAVEAYDCIFADLVEKDPAMRADAIQLLVFLGLPERALQVAESLPEGPEKVELLKQIARERDAWALLSEVRDLAARAASDDAALLLLYRQVDRLIDGFRDTRAYLLNRRAPSPAAKPASRPAGS